jgi:hypothetical protein
MAGKVTCSGCGKELDSITQTIETELEWDQEKGEYTLQENVPEFSCECPECLADLSDLVEDTPDGMKAS